MKYHRWSHFCKENAKYAHILWNKLNVVHIHIVHIQTSIQTYPGVFRSNISTTDSVNWGQYLLLMNHKSLLHQHCFVLLLHKQFQLHVFSICCQNTLCKWNVLCCSFVVIVHVMMYFSSRPVDGDRDTDELLYVFVSALDRSHFKTLKILEYI